MAVARRRLHFLLSQQLEIKKNVKMSSFEQLKTPQVQLINTIEQPESVTFWIREREKENSWAGNFSTTRRGNDELLMRAMRPYLPRHAVLNNINSWQVAVAASTKKGQEVRILINSRKWFSVFEAFSRLEWLWMDILRTFFTLFELLHSLPSRLSTSSHLFILILGPSLSTTLLAHHTQSGRLREL